MENLLDEKLWMMATRFLFTSILLGPRPFLTVAASWVHDLRCCSSFFLISLNCQPALLAMNLQPAACFHSNKLLSIIRVVRPSLAWKATRRERRHVLISPVRRISARPSKGQSELPISRLPPSSIWTRDDDNAVCILWLSTTPHMGQFLQGGKNGRLMSFFFLK